MAPAARERRPLASSPGGGRHRCAKRSERRVRGSRPDDAERRGTGREASHSGTRGPSRPPAFGGLCRPGEVGVPLPARRSAWWRGCRDLHHPGNCTCRAGCAGGPIMASSPGGGRHRCAKRSERRVLRSRPDDAERRGTGRGANHPPNRGPSLPPACGGLCRAPPGQLPRGRRSKPSPRFTWTEYGSFAALRAAMPV